MPNRPPVVFVPRPPAVPPKVFVLPKIPPPVPPSVLVAVPNAPVAVLFPNSPPLCCVPEHTVDDKLYVLYQ